MVVKDLMTTTLVTIDVDANLGDAMFLMQKHKVRHLPVMRNGRLAGMISARDVSGWLTPRIATEDEQEGEAEALDYVIEDVMATELITIGESDEIARAAELFAEKRIGGIPVLDSSGSCTGIVTVVDLLEEFARRLRGESRISG